MGEVVSVIRAFSADHAVRLTGLSMRQLRYWDDTGFFRHRYASEDRRSPYGRVYSFRDIVGLRTLSVLRKRPREQSHENSLFDALPSPNADPELSQGGVLHRG